MSIAINTLHALPELPDTRQVGGLQQARHRAAARNIQVGVEVREADEVEGAAHPPVRHPEVGRLDDLIPEEQHVDVDGARLLLPLALPPEPGLNTLAIAQQLDRRQAAPNLDHAVQVLRLAPLDLDRGRLVHLRRTPHLQRRPAPEGPGGGPQVAQAVPQVASQAQESAGHPRTVAETQDVRSSRAVWRPWPGSTTTLLARPVNRSDIRTRPPPRPPTKSSLTRQRAERTASATARASRLALRSWTRKSV